MKTKLLLSVLFLSLLACDKHDNAKLDSIDFEFSFSTETRPIALAIEKDNGFVYIANHNPSVVNYSSKIQKFNLKGDMINTILDFDTFFDGKYTRYTPKDMCLNNSTIFVLVRPSRLSVDTWTTYTGFL